MITEDQLEQLAIQWFQDTGRAYANDADLAPEYSRETATLTPALSQGEREWTPERVEFRAVALKAWLWEGGGFHA